MRWLPQHKISPIGLDLGSHSFKAAQALRSASSQTLRTAVSLARRTPGAPLDAGDIDRLLGVLDRRGFVGRDVVVTVPAATLLTTILELPARAPGVPLEKIAAVEFSRVHKHEPAALTFSTWDLPAPARASKATYMLAVGAVSEKLEAHIDLIESQGLNVVAIEEPYSAAARGGCFFSKAQSGFTAVIDMGWEKATLVILKENTIVYTRKLSGSGIGHLYRALSETSAGDAEALEHELWRVGFDELTPADLDNAAVLDTLESHIAGATDEIRQAFGYTTHQYPDAVISKAIVIGGGAQIPGLAGRLEKSLGVPTVIAGADAIASAGVPPLASVASALGLALFPGELR
jgi:Tfp pilus assembly PilM family ATPase